MGEVIGSELVAPIARVSRRLFVGALVSGDIVGADLLGKKVGTLVCVDVAGEVVVDEI